MTPIRNASDRERQLCAEIEQMTASRDEWKSVYEAAFRLARSLTAERDALKADALRYRWLREQNACLDDFTFYVAQDSGPDQQGNEIEWIGSDLDVAIDAAMKEGAQ